MDIPHSTVTGLRMKFAKERTFVFDVFFANFNYDTREWEQVTEVRKNTPDVSIYLSYVVN